MKYLIIFFSFESTNFLLEFKYDSNEIQLDFVRKINLDSEQNLDEQGFCEFIRLFDKYLLFVKFQSDSRSFSIKKLVEEKARRIFPIFSLYKY